MPSETHTVKEGWMAKRGEYIKNWRNRYFVLRSDGVFLCYQVKPFGTGIDPLNVFSVAGCQIIKNSKLKENSFIIHFFQYTKLIERIFAVESPSDKEDWINTIEEVVKRLKKEQQKTDSIGPVTENEKQAAKLTLDDFEMLKVLGKGTFGKVMLGKEKKSGNVYAIKIFNKSITLAKDQDEYALTGNRPLQPAKHPFIAELKYSFQSNDQVIFVMEYVNGGELFSHLSSERVFSESKTRFYGAEITLGLKYLHEHKIVWRDLKLENLLIDSDGHIKLADLSLKDVVAFGSSTKTFCGTPEYLAPEVLEDNDYGRAVDWWGLGVVLYEMHCGRLPFYSRDHEVLFELILVEEVKFPARLSAQSKSLFNGLLQKDPKNRLGGGVRDAEEVMAHKFFELINWDDILHKKVPPPFKPTIKNSEDAKFFDENFSGEAPQLTPPEDGGAITLAEETYSH